MVSWTGGVSSGVTNFVSILSPHDCAWGTALTQITVVNPFSVRAPPPPKKHPHTHARTHANVIFILLTRSFGCAKRSNMFTFTEPPLFIRVQGIWGKERKGGGGAGTPVKSMRSGYA